MIKNPRILAWYLPQYHHVKENDLWWGEGFTDWVAVRNSRPLFEGHQQPRVPLHGNYYDLMNRSVMQHQSELMHRYGIDGMAIYHYWFKDGRQILERPAENLLRWKDIPMEFCFCWANETWARTWSKLRKKQQVTPWTDDSKRDMSLDVHVREDGVLLDQRYGDADDWRKHIEYLLPFFQDSRYLRQDGKPVFIFYRGNQIYCLSEMLACWNEVLQKHGIPGLYVICEVPPSFRPRWTAADAWLFRSYDGKRMVESNGLVRCDYDSHCAAVLKTVEASSKSKIPVCYVAHADFDNTPRMGTTGLVMDGVTPEKFEGYLKRLITAESRNGAPFAIVNAWNEWGEGAYLEPDELRGYAMLEAVKRAKEACASGKLSLDVVPVEKPDVQEEPKESMEELRAQVDKDTKAFARSARIRQILVDWLSIAQRGMHVSDYLKRLGMQRIAVYGIGFLGQRFIEDLEAAGLKLVYAVDQRGDAPMNDVRVYRPGDTLPSADAIVVTPYGMYDEIYMNMKGRVPCRMISLEHMISELL